MTDKEIEKFYHSIRWKRLRIEVLQEQHFECQHCKGKYHRLTLLNHQKASVHHIKEVRDYPQLRFSKYYYEQGVRKRNLIALCDECHNELHNRFQKSNEKAQFNEEKW